MAMLTNWTNAAIECLAAMEGKALVTLEPDQIKPGLDRREQLPVCLRLAQRWNAIMLITSADCYVRMERSENSNMCSGTFLLYVTQQ